MKYRADVDGLRAVAVLSVVLYHVGVEFFTGGYVGVDVFFVISGYLITSIIAWEIREGRFSIITFYERRIRRLFPALFAMIAFSSVTAAFIFLPSEFESFARSVVAATLFVSNILFWQEAGYFGAPAETKPLLHTWSLAVEEQFYIFFPIFLLLVHRWLKGRWILWLLPVIALSFALSVLATERWANANFYLSVTRAWELLLGSLLALGAFPALRSRLLREVEALAGIALIAWAVFAFSQTTPFPGVNALYPCVGAALVIHAGERGSTLIGRILSLRPIVFVGLISYSLYLWHWPFIVFAKYYNIDPLSAWQMVGVIALSFLVAIVSWRFIEQPFRKKRPVFNRRTLFPATASVMSCAVAFGMLGHVSQGWSSRLPQDVLKVSSYASDSSPLREECHSDSDNWIPFEEKCVYGANTPPEFVIWGDSYAVELAVQMGIVSRQYGRSTMHISYSLCPPALGMEVDTRPDCLKHNDYVMENITNSSTISAVFLIANYEFYTNDDMVDDFLAGFRESVTRIIEAGKDVVLIYPIPVPEHRVPHALARYMLSGAEPSEYTIDMQSFIRTNLGMFRFLNSLGTRPEIHRMYPHDYLCDEYACMTNNNDGVFYFDDHHLSLTGTKYLSPMLEEVFSRLVLKRPEKPTKASKRPRGTERSEIRPGRGHGASNTRLPTTEGWMAPQLVRTAR